MESSVNYSGGSLILAALMLLLLPLKWIIAAIFAAFIHEICHYIVIKLSGSDIIEVKFTQRGILMKTAPLSNMQELICALAGPAGGMLLFLFYRRIPRIAICAAIQGLFNLLPVYPLDGGRALRSFAVLFFSQNNAERFCRWIMYGTSAIILLTGICCTSCLKLGISPMFLSLLLLSRVLSEKFLANREN